ncbi:hypothetical protein [Caballeronia sp. AZ1_KS37]|uniref:hypothetical protein n=1 Tax=Caballeronia sp. AZ1_KS37 TaxID=2921756 RepID=UPI00202812E9|nr:hypothetical protein [Caballeronia sp. AZ1_KS37]
MNSFEDFIMRLRKNDHGDFVASASRILRQPGDWLEIARVGLSSLSDEKLQKNIAATRVHNVQPCVFPIHVEAGQFSVVLNLYSKFEFDDLTKRGYVSPHYHHFSFCSRILRGRFYHLVFQNAGEPIRPSLMLTSGRWFREGEVIELPYPTFHSVMEPEDSTVTLMIRGRPLFSMPHIGDPEFRIDQARSARRQLEAALVDGVR